MAQETGYTIVYKEENDPNWTEVTLPADTVDYTIPGLTPGHKYQIGVKAEGDDSTVVDSPYSNMLEIYTYLQFDPVTVDSVETTMTTFTIYFTDPNADPTNIPRSYTLFYRKVGDTTWIESDAVIPVVGGTGLVPATTYEYYIRVVPSDTDRYLYADTTIFTVDTTDALNAPALAPIWDNGDGTYTFDWVDTSAEPYKSKGAHIEQNKNGGGWEVAYTIPEGEYTYTTTIEYGSYEFRVVLLGDGVTYFDSDPSNVETLVIIVTLVAPTLSLDSKTVDSIVVDWTDPNN